MLEPLRNVVMSPAASVLFGSAVALLVGPALAQPGGKPQPPKPVVVAPVVEREVAAGQTFVGTVVPTRRATVGSAVAGRVVEFPIELGDRVEAKQTLAQVLTDTINLDLAAAEAELQLRQAELRELENGSRPEEIDQARARLASAQATNQYNQARLQRTEAVYRRGGVTEEAVDEIRSLGAAAEQTLKEAEAAYRLVQTGPREEQIARARANVAVQDAIVRKLKDQIVKHTIITRFAGYVVAEHTEVGAWVNQGDPVAEIVALDEIDVESYVPENAIPFVRKGEIVTVEIPALPTKRFEGIVLAVSPQADLRARTFPVKVRVKNEIAENGPLLKSGMLARVVLPTGGVGKALLVPKDALVLGGPRPAVVVADPDPADPRKATVRTVPVDPGAASGSSVVVTGDLKPGQTVVVQGNERLRPGETVSIVRTLAPEGGAK